MSVTVPAVTLSDLDDAVFRVPATVNDDMYKVLTRPTNAELTTRIVGGTGTFDALMASGSEHLKVEYEKGRITGAEYTRAYIAMAEAAMASSVQFALGRDQAFWQAQTAQVAAVKARVDLETARMKHVYETPAQIELLTKQSLQVVAQTVLTTKQTDLATAQISQVQAQVLQTTAETARVTAQTDQVEAQTAQVAAQTAQIPVQTAMIQAQTGQVTAQTAQVAAQTLQVPVQTAQIQAQTAQTQAQTALVTAQATTIPLQNTQIQATTGQTNAQTAQITAQTSQVQSQIALTNAQTLIATEQVQATIAQAAMLREQTEAQRAQTSDTRTTGAVVGGVLGKQRELFGQQITSYQRDSEIKTAKLFSDAWITQKTIDEGLSAPSNFTNSTVDTVLTKLRTNTGLV